VTASAQNASGNARLQRLVIRTRLKFGIVEQCIRAGQFRGAERQVVNLELGGVDGIVHGRVAHVIAGAIEQGLGSAQELASVLHGLKCCYVLAATRS
jgi:hypothetical protein